MFSVEESKVRQFLGEWGISQFLLRQKGRGDSCQLFGWHALFPWPGVRQIFSFGVAVAASVPKGGLWGAVLGAFIGYLIPSPVYVPARYAAALVAVAAIRWSLSELKNVNTHPLYAPVVTFLPLLLTGMTMVFLNGSITYSAALYVAESFLGAGCAYFLNRTSNLLVSRREDGAV